MEINRIGRVECGWAADRPDYYLVLITPVYVHDILELFLLRLVYTVKGGRGGERLARWRV